MGGILPPMVFVGQTVGFVGKLLTYNEGKIFMVTEAVPFKKDAPSYWRIMGPVYAHVWQYLEDPRTWVESQPILDAMRLRELYAGVENETPVRS